MSENHVAVLRGMRETLHTFGNRTADVVALGAAITALESSRVREGGRGFDVAAMVEEAVREMCSYPLPLAGEDEDQSIFLTDVLADAMGDETIGNAEELIGELAHTAITAALAAHQQRGSE